MSSDQSKDLSKNYIGCHNFSNDDNLKLNKQADIISKSQDIKLN